VPSMTITHWSWARRLSHGRARWRSHCFAGSAEHEMTGFAGARASGQCTAVSAWVCC